MKKNKESTKKVHLHRSNQESKTLTREYIKTALLYLMKEIPYEKITVTAIINRAGVSRAGFYRNYGSKEEVLEDIAVAVYGRVTTYLEELKTRTPYERYRALFQRLKEQIEWFRIITMVSDRNQHIFNITPYIEEYLSPDSVEDHYRYIALAHSQRAIILNWYENGMKESPEEMASIFVNIYHDIHV